MSTIYKKQPVQRDSLSPYTYAEASAVLRVLRGREPYTNSPEIAVADTASGAKCGALAEYLETLESLTAGQKRDILRLAEGVVK